MRKWVFWRGNIQESSWAGNEEVLDSSSCEIHVSSRLSCGSAKLAVVTGRLCQPISDEKKGGRDRCHRPMRLHMWFITQIGTATLARSHQSRSCSEANTDGPRELTLSQRLAPQFNRGNRLATNRQIETKEVRETVSSEVHSDENSSDRRGVTQLMRLREKMMGLRRFCAFRWKLRNDQLSAIVLLEYKSYIYHCFTPKHLGRRKKRKPKDINQRTKEEKIGSIPLVNPISRASLAGVSLIERVDLRIRLSERERAREKLRQMRKGIIRERIG